MLFGKALKVERHSKQYVEMSMNGRASLLTTIKGYLQRIDRRQRLYQRDFWKSESEYNRATIKVVFSHEHKYNRVVIVRT